MCSFGERKRKLTESNESTSLLEECIERMRATGILLPLHVDNREMVEIREVQDIVNTVVSGVELPQVDEEVQAVELRDPAGAD